MNYFSSILSMPFMAAAGWTIVHSLWIGIVVFCIVAFCQAIFGRNNAARNYQFAFGGQVFLFLSSIAVFTYYFLTSASYSAEPTFFMEASSGAASSGLTLSREWSYIIARQAPTIAMIWLAGMVFLLIKLVFGYNFIYRLRKKSKRVEDESMKRLIDRIAFILRVDKPCDVRLTDQLVSPLMAGLYRPFIVMPLAVINSLEMDEVELILAHEIAHLKRQDHLALFVQQCIESVLYFNPAVWLLSRHINKYREEACDDLVVARMGRDMNYAKSLVKLQELQINQSHQVALSALGQKNQLLHRIKRIMNMETTQRHNLGRILLILMIPFAFGLLSFYTKHESSTDRVEKLDVLMNEVEARAMTITVDTVPVPKSKTRIIEKIVKKDDGKEIEAEFEGDLINYLKIDGQEVSPEENVAIVEDLRSELSAQSHVGQGGAFFFGSDDMDFDFNFDASGFNFNGEEFDFDAIDLENFELNVKELDGDMKAFLKTLDTEMDMDQFFGTLQIDLDSMSDELGVLLGDFDNATDGYNFKFYSGGDDFLMDLNGEKIRLEDLLDEERLNEIKKRFPVIEEQDGGFYMESGDGDMIIMRREDLGDLGEKMEMEMRVFSEESQKEMEKYYRKMEKGHKQMEEANRKMERAHDKRARKMQQAYKERQRRMEEAQNRRAREMDRMYDAQRERAEASQRIRQENIEEILERADNRGALNKGTGLRRAIERALKKDGHVSSTGSYSFKLKEGKLKINGKRQSQAEYEKYKSIYERYSGNSIKGNSYSTSISGI